MIDGIIPKPNQFEKSFATFQSLLTTDYRIESYPPRFAKDTIFGKEFPGAHIHKPQYTNCIFVESSFISSDGAQSIFHQCKFNDCLFENCDFRYCDIFKTRFYNVKKEVEILSSNFSFGNFIETSFNNINFVGCSFRQMQFEYTSFIDCNMEFCSLEQSTISNCNFQNIDLRRVGVRYCTFKNNNFDSTVFHILDLARNYGLINELKNSPKDVLVAYGNDKLMKLDEAIIKLQDLIPYYIETNQYYELINTYVVHNKFQSVFDVLPKAFKDVINSCDFSSLRDLCSLIVNLKICDEKQLREFYNLITQLIIPDKFPHYLRKSYNSYIENIRHILLENPHDYPEADLLFKTDIDSLENSDMLNVIMAIETNIKSISPEIDVTIKLTHHSPYEILITLCGIMPDILSACQIFYYSLGGTKAYFDLKRSKKEKVSNKNLINNNHDLNDESSSKRIELSIGKSFSFKYEKEFSKHIKSYEYTIK